MDAALRFMNDAPSLPEKGKKMKPQAVNDKKAAQDIKIVTKKKTIQPKAIGKDLITF